MLLTPFLIGLAGSLHCIGMCSPLSALVTHGGRSPAWKSAYYNVGRIITYGLLGSIVSFIGGITSFAGIQSWISWIVGASLLLIGVTGMQLNSPRMIARPLGAFSGFLKARFSVLLNMKSSYGVLGMGMINGLLPCGMTWIALAYCITLQWPLDGFISMGLFGLGTLPAMIGFPTFIGYLNKRFRFSYRSIQTTLLVISGLLLIARTFSSPEAAKDGEIATCGIHSTNQK